MIKRILLSTVMIINLCLNYSTIFASDTIEINTQPNLHSTLIENKEASQKLMAISKKYLDIYQKQSIDKNFYLTVQSFIAENPQTLSSLSALLMIYTMCFLDNDEGIYNKEGRKILDYITSKYSNTLHAKIALFLMAERDYSDRNFKDSFKKLNEYYEVMLLVENDKYFKTYLKELNLKEKTLVPEYYFLLGNVNYHLGKDDEAIKVFNKIIIDHPDSIYSEAAQRVINGIKAINKAP